MTPEEIRIAIECLRTLIIVAFGVAIVRKIKQQK